jgi:predicted outer membrane protein
MAKGHDKAVALFESASQQPQMPEDLKQFAASTLPTLEQHKDMAHSLHE